MVQKMNSKAGEGGLYWLLLISRSKRLVAAAAVACGCSCCGLWQQLLWLAAVAFGCNAGEHISAAKSVLPAADSAVGYCWAGVVSVVSVEVVVKTSSLATSLLASCSTCVAEKPADMASCL